jgi:hypothetical protein
VLELTDASARLGLLGHHCVQPDGLPFATVAVGAVRRRGRPVSLIASHELAELLTNPWCDRTARRDDGSTVAVECCDPVEEEQAELDGIVVCDFVYPAWFGLPGDGRLDHLGRVRAPFEVLPRGRVPILERGSNQHG